MARAERRRRFKEVGGVTCGCHCGWAKSWWVLGTSASTVQRCGVARVDAWLLWGEERLEGERVQRVDGVVSRDRERGHGLGEGRDQESRPMTPMPLGRPHLHDLPSSSLGGLSRGNPPTSSPPSTCHLRAGGPRA